MKLIFKQAEIAALECTEYLNETMCPIKGVVELEFEKVLFWLICYAKKRYAFVKYTDLKKPGTFSAMGMQFVRRDFCSLARKLTKDTLFTLLVERDLEKAKQLVIDCIDNLASHSVDLNDLAISKTLRSSYNTTPPAHAIVARKRRDRGEDVCDGDRVQFVYTVTEGRIQSERVDDPKFIFKNNIPVDYLAYFESQIHNPIFDNLGPVIPEIKQILLEGKKKIQKSQEDSQRKLYQQMNKIPSITSFFNKCQL